MQRLLLLGQNCIAVLSAVLGAATCALWVRSYTSPSQPFDRLPFPEYAASSSAGVLAVRRPYPGNQGDLWLYAQETQWSTDNYAFVAPETRRHMPGLDRYDLVLTVGRSFGGTHRYRVGWEVHIRYALLMFIWTALPAVVVLRRVGTRIWTVKPEGLCRTCGYDLRATPERCPECGKPRANTTPSPSAGTSQTSPLAGRPAPRRSPPVP